MGARKHIAAEKLKEARKNLYFAKLKGVPSSPRKMRYVVDMIRGLEVNLLLTGRQRMIVKLKMASCISAVSSLMKALR